MTQTTTLSLFRFDRWQDRLWALWMMGGARPALARMPGLGFWKLCGSGAGEGFDLRPNTAVWAILCSWSDAETARAQIEGARLFQRYRARADAQCTLFLETTSVRGQWSGQTPFAPTARPQRAPIAALTRASIRPRIMHRFWGRVPDISDVIGDDPNVLMKIGIGELPYLHQITFSIWPDEASMAAFARRDGPHARAIKAVREGGWFREELYARFHVTDTLGHWPDMRPLERT